MVQDYPDYMQDVDRSPVQKTGYQIYGVHSAENQVAAANNLSSDIWNIPDDGYYYLVESVYFIANHLFAFDGYISMAYDQLAPSFFIVSYKRNEGDVQLDMSAFGSFAIRYPVALAFRMFNYRSVSTIWSVYVNYYKYLPGS
jgi:hypothetical protein